MCGTCNIGHSIHYNVGDETAPIYPFPWNGILQDEMLVLHLAIPCAQAWDFATCDILQTSLVFCWSW